MPAPPSIPRWMNESPENGYETPRYEEDESVFFGNSVPVADGGRRRNPIGDDGLQAQSEQSREDSAVPENGHSLAEKHKAEDRESPKKIGIRDRISCYTWTWFTMTMATGGIANVIHSIPYQSEWLRIIGVIIFLFNIVLFALNCTFITLRFKLNPGSFKASFTSPSESLFIPACVVSLGTILMNMCQYGLSNTGIWFQRAMQVCFWAYIAISFLTSSAIYLIIWSTQSFPIHTMTPIWIFPAYPLLIAAPIAFNLISALPDGNVSPHINTLAMALGAVSIQGTGFCVSLMIYSAFIYRLMTQKLPREKARPGMFVSVGPSAFTAAGTVGLGTTASSHLLPNGLNGIQNASFFLKLIADLVGFSLYGLCLWFFVVSVGAHWTLMRPGDPNHHLRFDMTWFSFVFPNTAMVTATQAIATSVDSNGLKIFGTVLSVLLILVWLYVLGMMIRALALRRLLWPEQADGDLTSKK